jgi:hypothetical protein
MTNYWLKIVAGALAIFAVGMLAVKLIGRAKDRIEVVATTSDPITIPFPGSFVPFNLDGRRVGSLKEMTVYRSAPKVPDHVDLQVALADSFSSSRLSGCILVAEKIDNIDQHTSFTCMTAKDTAGRGLAALGGILVRGSEGGRFEVLAPRKQIEDFRRSFSEERAQRASDAAEARADSVADSIETAANRIADSVEAAAESSRGEVEARIDRQRAVADSIRNAAQQQAEQARAR